MNKQMNEWMNEQMKLLLSLEKKPEFYKEQLFLISYSLIFTIFLEKLILFNKIT